jgi:hypothetical protein
MRTVRKNPISAKPFGEVLRISLGDVLAGEVGFEGCRVGGVWLDGGIGLFLDEDRRLGLSKLVEEGELQLFGDTESPGCQALPLSIADFTFCERDGMGVLGVDLAGWEGACRTLAMYAALAGVGRGVSGEEIREQCRRIVRMEPPGHNKP